MVHSDACRTMWSMTFSGAIECGNMLITEITLNKTTLSWWHLVAFCITSNIRFLNTPVYLLTLKDMTDSLNCILVLLCTQSMYFVWAVVMGVTSLADFHSTSLFSK